MDYLNFFNTELNTEIEDLDDIYWSNPEYYKLKLSTEFLRIFKRYIDWTEASMRQKFTDEELDEFKYYIKWECVLKTNKLSDKTLRKFIKYLPKNILAACQYLSEDLIEEYKYSLNWKDICAFQHLSENFMSKHEHKLDWDGISSNQTLSESFIEKYIDKVNWVHISSNQVLSETFIEKHKNRVYWINIVMRQFLSEPFIVKNLNNINLDVLVKYQKLSPEFIENHKLSVSAYTFMYKTTEEIKAIINNLNLYECYDDYFIAYKGIRLNRRSVYKISYTYDKGSICEAYPDYNNVYCSFGLHVAPKQNARNFCSELLIRCKVYYKDVAYCSKVRGRIRCSKLEVLD